MTQYVADRFQQRLREYEQNGESLEAVLRSKPELWKLVSWLDSGSNVVNATEIVLHSVIEKPEAFGELLASTRDPAQFRERLCTENWSRHLTVPPGARQDDVRQLLVRICDVDWEKLAVEAVEVLEANSTSVEEAVRSCKLTLDRRGPPSFSAIGWSS